MLKKALISICILLVVGLGVWKIFFGGETIKDKVENISESLTSYNIEGNMEIINGEEKRNFNVDYKSILQEAIQTDKRSLLYETINETGPAHNKEFTVIVKIDNVIYGKGIANSKKEASKLAAKATLEKLAKGNYE